MYFTSVKSERLALLTSIMKSLWGGRQNAVTARDDLVPSLAHPPKETTTEGFPRSREIEWDDSGKKHFTKKQVRPSDFARIPI